MSVAKVLGGICLAAAVTFGAAACGSSHSSPQVGAHSAPTPAQDPPAPKDTASALAAAVVASGQVSTALVTPKTLAYAVSSNGIYAAAILDTSATGDTLAYFFLDHLGTWQMTTMGENSPIPQDALYRDAAMPWNVFNNLTNKVNQEFPGGAA